MGAIYPFVGSEGLLVIIGLVTWVGWHVVQTKRENERYEEQKRMFTKEKLSQVIGAEDPENPQQRCPGMTLPEAGSGRELGFECRARSGAGVFASHREP